MTGPARRVGGTVYPPSAGRAGFPEPTHYPTGSGMPTLSTASPHGSRGQGVSHAPATVVRDDRPVRRIGRRRRGGRGGTGPAASNPAGRVRPGRAGADGAADEHADQPAAGDEHV